MNFTHDIIIEPEKVRMIEFRSCCNCMFFIYKEGDKEIPQAVIGTNLQNKLENCNNLASKIMGQQVNLTNSAENHVWLWVKPGT